MRSLILLPILILTVQKTFAQIGDANLREMKVKGPVKLIIDYTFKNAQNDKKLDTSKSSLKKLKVFNNDGNEIYETVFDTNKRLIRNTKCSYSGKQIIVATIFGRDGKPTFKHVYKYEKGKVSEVDVYSEFQSASPTRTTYTYDGNGNIIKTSLSSSDDNLADVYISTYNKKNQIIKEDFYDLDKKLSSKTYFTYDSRGNLINIKTYNPNNKLIEQNIYTYTNLDNDGNWLLQTYENKRDDSIARYYEKGVVKRILRY